MVGEPTEFALEKEPKFVNEGSIQTTTSTLCSTSTPEYHHSISCTFHSIAKMSTSELASSYAALILADDGVEVTVRSPALNSTPPKSDQIKEILEM